MIRSISQNYFNQKPYYIKNNHNINYLNFGGESNTSKPVKKTEITSSDEEIKKLKQSYNSLLVILSTLILGLSYLVYTGKGGGGKNPLFADSNKFISLKNNTQIPTLETCKSINKKLKTLLQNQVNYLNADKQLINDAGNADSYNRILLSGAPGNGKSFYAKIFAKTIGAEYQEVKQSDFNSRWAGEGTARFKNIFERILKTAAKNKDKQYVVCFNEIDTIVQPVEKISNTFSSTHAVTLMEHRSVFLNYMDELTEKTPNVIVIGTTNILPKNIQLDGASLSRFKQIIEVPFPDKECLYEALKNKLKNIKNSENFLKNNDSEILYIVEEMEKRKFSFRNLDTVSDDAKNLYLSDLMKNKNQEFQLNHLKQAVNDFYATDGELLKK